MQVIYLGDSIIPTDTGNVNVSNEGFWFYIHKNFYFLGFYNNTKCLIKIYSSELFVHVTKKKKCTFPYFLKDIVYQDVYIKNTNVPFLQTETFHHFYIRYDIAFFTLSYLAMFHICGVEDISKLILHYLFSVMVYYYDMNQVCFPFALNVPSLKELCIKNVNKIPKKEFLKSISPPFLLNLFF
jgi:hypothetical protein